MTQPKKPNRGLGRGLSALMADVQPEPNQTDDTPRKPDMFVPIEKVKANADQPRRTFEDSALNELATSIKDKGIIQPLIVRPHPKTAGDYEIVAGERRWRAAQIAQLHEVPVLVREYSDTESLEVAIIENIQRADLNPVEEATGYRELLDKFGHTQEKLADAMGKSRSHIANMMRLLNLPPEVQTFMREGKLSAGAARALVTAADPVALAKKAVNAGMSVREIERMAKAQANPQKPTVSSASSKAEKDADTIALENDLSATLGMKVFIDHKEGSESGTLKIQYKSLELLDDLCRKLGGDL